MNLGLALRFLRVVVHSAFVTLAAADAGADEAVAVVNAVVAAAGALAGTKTVIHNATAASQRPFEAIKGAMPKAGRELAVQRVVREQ